MKRYLECLDLDAPPVSLQLFFWVVPRTMLIGLKTNNEGVLFKFDRVVKYAAWCETKENPSSLFVPVLYFKTIRFEVFLKLFPLMLLHLRSLFGASYKGFGQ